MNMNNHYIFGIMQINSLLRDTLEYALPGREFNPDHYDKRVEGFNALLQENAPLKAFLNNNPEQKEKINENFTNFVNAIYSPEATIVRKIDNKIEVDKAGFLDLFEMVLGLNQTVQDIVNGYLKNARDNNQQDENMEIANYNGDLYFRAVANFVIIHQVVDSFNEFQIASREAKGQPSPAVNFIQSEIQKLVGFLNFIKTHSRIRDVGFNQSLDQINILVETISGKRNLPSGTTFDNLYKTTKEVLYKELATAEANHKQTFTVVLNDYIQTNHELQKRSSQQTEKNEGEN